MKLTLQHFSVRSTDALDSFVEERILILGERLQIDEASVRLERRDGASPPFRVQAHLVTPGPDLLAESQEHTLRAALEKVLSQLETKISHRHAKRSHRLKEGRVLRHSGRGSR